MTTDRISRAKVLDASNLRLRVGDIVKHFKRELLLDNQDQMIYLYQIVAYAMDTTNGGYCVVYKPMYDTEVDTFVRSADEFFAEVDKSKYPNIEQRYVFEKV